MINQVFSSNCAVKISPNSPVARICLVAGKSIPGEVIVGVYITCIGKININAVKKR